MTKVGETPYKQIYHAGINKSLREKPIETGIVQSAAAAGVYTAALKSQTVQKVIQKGGMPAVGAGMVLFGATMAQDAVSSDLQSRPTKAGGKMMMGAGAIAAGSTLIGKGLNVPALANTSRNWALTGAGVLTSGVLMAYDGAKNDFAKQPVAGKVAAGTLEAVTGAAIIARAVGGKPVIASQTILNLPIKHPAIVGPALAGAGYTIFLRSMIDGEEHKTRELEWCKKHTLEMGGGLATMLAGSSISAKAFKGGEALAGKLGNVALISAGGGLGMYGVFSLQDAAEQFKKNQTAKGVKQAVIGAGTIGAGAAIITAGVRPDLAAKVIQHAKNLLPALKLVR